LFSAVLELCGKAGLVRSGVVAFDGTKRAVNANRDRNLDYGQIAREIIDQALLHFRDSLSPKQSPAVRPVRAKRDRPPRHAFRAERALAWGMFDGRGREQSRDQLRSPVSASPQVSGRGPCAASASARRKP
jgi:hypothetical protein